ncbi:MAG TPA: response regulator, partial [Blastocatellia bacterium]|nr:response regulator [Blastocatellia bacterium]
CVDDDTDTCDMVSYFLGQAGFEVRVARSLLSALELARRERFDLYILDNRLSDGTGLELFEQIRAFDKATPVIFCSGEGDLIEELALGMGVHQFFRKPVGLDHLSSAVSKLTAEGAPRSTC